MNMDGDCGKGEKRGKMAKRGYYLEEAVILIRGGGIGKTEERERKRGEKIEKSGGGRRMVVVYGTRKLGVGARERDDRRSNQSKRRNN